MGNNTIFYSKVLGLKNEFHFQHRALPHARTKRSIGHYRQLKSEPLVSMLIAKQLGKWQIKLLLHEFNYSLKTI